MTAGLDLVTQDAHLDQGLAAIDWSKSSWETPTVIYVPLDDDTDPEA